MLHVFPSPPARTELPRGGPKIPFNIDSILSRPEKVWRGPPVPYPGPPVWLYKPGGYYGQGPRGGCRCPEPQCPDRGFAYPPCAPMAWRTGACKSKRIRTVFTPEQLERLEKEFLKQQYMVGTERVELASTLSLTETQVKVWFQNRRIKWRKQSLEQKKAKLSQFGVIPPEQASDHPEEKEVEEDDVDVEL